MTVTLTGVLLIGLPIAFNVCFALLGARFDYPDILRRPTAEVLAKFRAGGTGLVLLWWCFAMSALLLVPVVVLLAGVLTGADPTLVTMGVVAGVLAALVQVLGLIRWPFVVPYLARLDADESDASRRAAVDVVFQAFNRYLGVAVGEHLGYGLTGAWSVLAGVAMTQSGTVLPAWIGVVGIVVGAALLVCALEFVGPFEPRGWRLAGALTPIAYVVWSLWLVAAGILLIV